MDRKSKILLYVLFFLFMGTVMFSYAHYMIIRDFEVVYSEPEEGGVLDDGLGQGGTDTQNEAGSEGDANAIGNGSE